VSVATFPPWAEVGAERRAHVERVAALLGTWAVAIAVPDAERERWLRAAYLHDALRDADRDLLARLAPDAWGVPALRHGPAAARMAREQGEQDAGVLEAVHYHSVGYARWGRVGRMLYLADYLEPGRAFQQPERRALAQRVPGDPDGALREVVAARLRWDVGKGRPLITESIAFWNALVAPA
jgi:HD superfamily phosphohydrolase YqeK